MPTLTYRYPLALRLWGCYDVRMATHRYTGMEQNGAHHRCRVDLPEPEAAFVSALADEGAITPADVIRGIVRRRRREEERKPPGGSSTPPGQT